MKKKILLLSNILTIAALLFVAPSCSEDAMDEVNKDNDHATDVSPKFILADVLTASAFYNVGGDMNTYTSTYIEHEVGIHNQLHRAEHRQGEPTSATTFNNVWGNLYNALKDARIIIDKADATGNLVTKGIAEVMAAYTSAFLTDMYGDVPFSEAALVDENGSPLNMTPKIDKQEDIYAAIQQYLDQAISDLQGANAPDPVRGYDFVYNGDAAKWLKFAYGLKARYTMRLLNRSTSVNGDMEKVLDYVSKSFASAGEQAAYAVYDATQRNPLFDFQWSRDGLASSKSLTDKFIERNDPRIHRAFVNPDLLQMTGADDDEWYPAPNGESEELQYHYNTSVFVYSQIAPTLFLSYHELLFLKAEALCRLNRTAEAEATLEEAIVAAIANTESSIRAAYTAPMVAPYFDDQTSEAITPAEAAEYFATSVKPLFTANPLKETMIQKYLAFFGASGESPEAYNDVRRLKALGEDFITLANPNRFPLRCPYGNSDTTTNPAVQEAYKDGQYVYTEQVWWAGGTR